MYTVVTRNREEEKPTRREAIKTARQWSSGRGGRVTVRANSGMEIMHYRNGELQEALRETRRRR